MVDVTSTARMSTVSTVSSYTEIRFTYLTGNNDFSTGHKTVLLNMYTSYTLHQLFVSFFANCLLVRTCLSVLSTHVEWSPLS